MNDTLVVYDNEGFVQRQERGSNLREPVGIPFMWVEIPQGKYLTGIDVYTEEHTPVFEDLPKSETQLLQEQVNDLNMAMAALMGGAV